jgi:hypothetical protein
LRRRAGVAFLFNQHLNHTFCDTRFEGGGGGCEFGWWPDAVALRGHQLAELSLRSKSSKISESAESQFVIKSSPLLRRKDRKPLLGRARGLRPVLRSPPTLVLVTNLGPASAFVELGADETARAGAR